MDIAARVLVVDDDPTMRRVAVATLEGDGYQVDEAGNIRQALERIEAGRPDLILLDIMLPDGSGIRLCRALWAKIGRRTPILMMTALQDTKRHLSGFRAGAGALLVKPFSRAEILDSVRVQLRP